MRIMERLYQWFRERKQYMSIKAIFSRISRLFDHASTSSEERPASFVQPTQLVSAIKRKAMDGGMDFGAYVSLPNRYEVRIPQADWERFYSKDLDEVQDCLTNAVEGLKGEEPESGTSYRIGGDGRVRVSIASVTGLYDEFSIDADFEVGGTTAEVVCESAGPDPLETAEGFDPDGPTPVYHRYYGADTDSEDDGWGSSTTPVMDYRPKGVR